MIFHFCEFRENVREKMRFLNLATVAERKNVKEAYRIFSPTDAEQKIYFHILGQKRLTICRIN
jgi:hypothetical protein